MIPQTVPNKPMNGEAEAMLVRKHPEYFNSLGNSIWQGRIYTPAKLGIVTRSPTNTTAVTTAKSGAVHDTAPVSVGPS